MKQKSNSLTYFKSITYNSICLNAFRAHGTVVEIAYAIQRLLYILLFVSKRRKQEVFTVRFCTIECDYHISISKDLSLFSVAHISECPNIWWHQFFCYTQLWKLAKRWWLESTSYGEFCSIGTYIGILQIVHFIQIEVLQLTSTSPLFFVCRLGFWNMRVFAQPYLVSLMATSMWTFLIPMSGLMEGGHIEWTVLMPCYRVLIYKVGYILGINIHVNGFHHS